jgi:hypothetical protein
LFSAFILASAFIAASCFIFVSLLDILLVGVGEAAMAGVAIAMVITVTMVVMRVTFMGFSFKDRVVVGE